MQEKGLGTPATRAAIIEGLIYEKYMHREGRELVPTRQGVPADDPAARPRRRGPDQARADRQLGVPARRDGEGPARARRRSWREIAEMAERIVRKAKEYDRDTIPGDYATLTTPCPNCGGVVKENYRRYACTGSRRASAKAAASRSARSRAAARSSSTRSRPSCATRRSARSRASAPRPAGRSPPSSSSCATTRSTTGSSSSTSARTPSAKASRASRSTSPSQESLGACPKTQGQRLRVRHAATSASTRSARTSTCDFKSGKIILQQPVAREQMTKLLADRQDRPARGLRLQQDAAQVQGPPGLRQEGGQGRFRVRAAARRRPPAKAGRRRRRPRRSRAEAGVDGGRGGRRGRKVVTAARRRPPGSGRREEGRRAPAEDRGEEGRLRGKSAHACPSR